MLKIIIPIAGSSDVFEKSGFNYPKPLIDIKGKPMIQWVVERVTISEKTFQLIFIIREVDAIKFHLDNTLRLLSPSCKIVKLKKDTQGGLCSVLMAIDLLEVEDSLIVLNSDQVIDENFDNIFNFWKNNNCDAGVVTFNSVHPKWSYTRIVDNLVVQTAEKNPISNHAIAGYYYFSRAEDFINCSYQSILKNVQLDGNFYISPVLNEYVLANKKVMNFPIDNKMYHSFYSPQLLKEFENSL